MIFGTEYNDCVKKQYILDAADKLFLRQRRPKYSNEYLIDNILDCNLNFQSWSKYGKVLNKYLTYPKFHHKYLNEIYIKWSSLGIFESAYKNIIKENLEYNPTDIKLNTDVTCVSNMCGIEKIGINPEYTKKNVTKVAVLNTLNNTPISLNILENKCIHDAYKTLNHDKTSVQPLLNNILINMNDTGNMTINGDKAYISTDAYKYKNKNVTIITPKREKTLKQTKKEIKKIHGNIKTLELTCYKYKNKYGENSKNLLNCCQKIEKAKEKINKLTNHIDIINTKHATRNEKGTKRYLIENYFCSMKRIPKLYLRTDKLIKTFISTAFIGFMYNYKITQ